MSFHTFLSSEPQLVSDEKMEMLIEMIYDAMRTLLKKEKEILSDRSNFFQYTHRFFTQLGYLSLQEEFDSEPKFVRDEKNQLVYNRKKYPSLLPEVFKEIADYYLLRGTTWQRIDERLNRNPKLLTSRQKILADAFFNTDNGMDAYTIYTEIITNNEFEEYQVDDDESWCSTMLYDDANKF
tara:strand:+ start:379 stop:921 length:543 start_codon:yes stop_codon:yes gene_type:complete